VVKIPRAVWRYKRNIITWTAGQGITRRGRRLEDYNNEEINNSETERE
jgi:hypothetical protein